MNSNLPRTTFFQPKTFSKLVPEVNQLQGNEPSKVLKMSPGKTDVSDRSPKRRRVIKSQNDPSSVTDMLHVQQARLDADALTTPTIKTMLDNLIEKKRLKDEQKTHVEFVLRQIKTHLDKLPTKPKKFSVDSATTRNVLRKAAPGTPVSTLFRTPEYQILSMECSPPSAVDVVGSFMLNCATRPIADVAVCMPSDLFQSKDYINYRYHDKRLLYLVYLARHFIKGDDRDIWRNISLTEEWLNGDRDKPTLTVSHSDHPECIIRLIPVYETGLFSLDRLQGNRRNIRPSGQTSVVESAEEATIGYNHGILIDSSLKTVTRKIYTTCSTAPMFQDTVLLLDSWSVRNRLFNSKFLSIALLHHVIDNKLVPKHASREHLFRSALNAIRNNVMKTMQVDGLDICASHDEQMLLRAKRCAATSLRIIESRCGLDDPWNGIIPYLFTSARGAKAVPKPLCTIFDGILRISSVDQDVEFDEANVIKVIKKGFLLTGRVRSIERVEQGVYGILISSYEAACRKVDTRPDDEQPEAFLSFWGEKAMRRRFKDGKIIESVLWNGGPQTLNEIATYISKKHFESKTIVSVILGDLESVVDPGTSLLSSTRAIATFDQLASILRSLEGLPLSIRAVHATSSHLRRCGGYDLRSSQARKLPNVLDIVATFESTSAWPDDPVAIAAAKAGFYVALRKTLSGQGVDSKVTISFLDIFLGGFVFRLRLRVDREYIILKTSAETEADTLQWTTHTLVKYHDAVRSMSHNVIPAACRLVKRWLDAHLLFSCLGERADVLVELLVIGVVLHPNINPPRSPFAVFCRVLHLLVDFPWEVCPFTAAVTTEDEDAPYKISEDRNMDILYTDAIDTAQKRHKQKPMLLSVYAMLSSSDKTKPVQVEHWFDNPHDVEPAIYRRISDTAGACLGLLEAHICGRAHDQAILSIFTPPVVGDVLLKLNRTEGQKFAQMLRDRMDEYALFLTRNDGKEVHVIWRPMQELAKFSLRNIRFRVPAEDKKLKFDKAQVVAEMILLGEGLIEEVIDKEDVQEDE